MKVQSVKKADAMKVQSVKKAKAMKVQNVKKAKAMKVMSVMKKATAMKVQSVMKKKKKKAMEIVDRHMLVQNDKSHNGTFTGKYRKEWRAIDWYQGIGGAWWKRMTEHVW